MLSKESIPFLDIINMSRTNSKYNSLKSKLNKKWTKYLKNKQLFDEYMIYLSNYNAVGAEPMTYKELSNLCYNLDRYNIYIRSKNRTKHYINVSWKTEFRNFVWDSINWYDIKNIFLYAINGGYIKKNS